LKICLVTPYDLSLPGGVNKHSRSLAAHLRALGDDVEIVGPASTQVDLGDRVTGFPGVVSIHANNSDNRIGLFTSPLAVMRHVRRGAFDVVHVHEPLTPPLPFYAVWAANAGARVCTFHRYSEDEGTPTRLARQMLAPHLNAYHQGIAVSDAAARYAAVAWARPLAIVPNGVECDFLAPPPLASSRSVGAIRLLFVGQWMDERKGLSVLLDACRRVLPRGIDATLHIVGHSDREPDQALRDRAGVVVHGVVSDIELRRLLFECDALVAPGLGCESFGMVLTEGMAAGRALICSDIEGYRQVAAAEGACLVPPGDAARLAEAIEVLARAPERRTEMGEANLRSARQYDWPLVAARVREVYTRALDAAAS
jgi:phosphatidyl-myo-inositol alpha-mannosyltransferase